MDISRYASRLAVAARSDAADDADHINDDGIQTSVPGAFSGQSEPISRRNSLFVKQEPADAGLTGGTRSLSRRLLALNVPGFKPADKVIKTRSRKSNPTYTSNLPSPGGASA